MLDKYAQFLGVPEGMNKFLISIFYKLDQFRIILLMLASFPLGLINYSLKIPKIRLWYGLITGLILQYLMYKNAIIHTISATMGTYLFIRFLGRKVSGFWVLGLTVLHLSALHIYRMIKDWGGWNLDVSTIYMM
jgi:lysophospholipid acyltransferase